MLIKWRKRSLCANRTKVRLNCAELKSVVISSIAIKLRTRKWNGIVGEKKFGVTAICLQHEFIIFSLFYFYNNFRYPQRFCGIEYNERTRGRTRNFTPSNGPNLINVRAPRDNVVREMSFPPYIVLYLFAAFLFAQVLYKYYIKTNRHLIYLSWQVQFSQE